MEASGELHALIILPTGKEPCSTYCVVGWVGPTADLDSLEKRSISALLGFEA
jgi:hypothetical protein